MIQFYQYFQRISFKLTVNYCVSQTDLLKRQVYSKNWVAIFVILVSQAKIITLKSRDIAKWHSTHLIHVWPGFESMNHKTSK